MKLPKSIRPAQLRGDHVADPPRRLGWWIRLCLWMFPALFAPLALRQAPDRWTRARIVAWMARGAKRESRPDALLLERATKKKKRRWWERGR